MAPFEQQRRLRKSQALGPILATHSPSRAAEQPSCSCAAAGLDQELGPGIVQGDETEAVELGQLGAVGDAAGSIHRVAPRGCLCASNLTGVSV